MSDPSEPPKSPAPAPSPSGERRRLLQGGLAVGPVLMTVMSRPVLGQTACVSPSCMSSMTHSGPSASVQSCNGLTPDQWGAMASQWPSPYVGGMDPTNPTSIDTLSTTTSDPPAITATTTTTASTNHRMPFYRPSSTSTLAPVAPSIIQPTQTASLSPTTTSTTTVSSSLSSRRMPFYRPSTSTTPSTPVSPPTQPSSVPCSTSAPPTTTVVQHRMPFYRPSTTTTTTTTTTTSTQPCTAPPTTTPPTTTADGTPFHSQTTGFGGNIFGSHTMENVIAKPSGTGYDMVGAYMVAALLNARSGRTPVLKETGVRNMWNDLVNRGYYEPTAGVRWGAPEIVAYLRTTMG